MMRRTILKWEIAGIVVIALSGSLLHFLFELTGRHVPVALIAAVNESTWEHLKIAFWPAVFYALIEWFSIRQRTSNFLFAKGTGILLMPVSIVVLFYAYTAFLEDNLIVDILIFVVAIIIGQLVSYRLLVARQLPKGLAITGAVMLVGLVLAFSLLTFYAPHFPLFKDPVIGSYGIP